MNSELIIDHVMIECCNWQKKRFGVLAVKSSGAITNSGLLNTLVVAISGMLVVVTPRVSESNTLLHNRGSLSSTLTAREVGQCVSIAVLSPAMVLNGEGILLQPFKPSC